MIDKENEKTKAYYNAQEISDMLGVSLGHSYKIIRSLNNELTEQGYMTISGKIAKNYFEKRYFV